MGLFERRFAGSSRWGGVLIAGAVVAAAVALSGCSVSVGDLPIVGVPEGAPERPKDPGTFPAVNDMPAARPDTALDRAEQARLESELAAARDRQAAAAAAANK